MAASFKSFASASEWLSHATIIGLALAGLVARGPEPPAPSVAGGPFQVVRARVVPVAEIVLGQEGAAYEILAGRRKAREDAKAPAPPPHSADAAGRSGGPPGTGPAARDDAAKTPEAGKAVGPAKQEPVEATASPADAAAAPAKEEWQPVEIASALMECVRLLAPRAAEVDPVEPSRQGPCGTPAPVLLKSVGGKDGVKFDPPVEVNCKLAAGLADWVELSLQPSAQETLRSRVARIKGASGYSCRNRYGLPNAPLSEHALANAIDVPAFVLADGRTVSVEAAWGPTARDLRAKEKTVAASDKAKAGTNPAEPAKSPEGGTSTEAARDAGGGDRKGRAARGGKSHALEMEAPASEASPVPLPVRNERKVRQLATLKGVAVQRLGVEPPVTKTAAPHPVGETPATGPARPAAEGQFLRRLAKSACEAFGTVLGPESNEAHRDHFHLDLKPRRKRAFCQ